MKLKNALMFSGLMALASCSNDSPNGPNEPNIVPDNDKKTDNCTLMHPKVYITRLYCDGEDKVMNPGNNHKDTVEVAPGYHCDYHQLPQGFEMRRSNGEVLYMTGNPDLCQPMDLAFGFEPWESMHCTYGTQVEVPAVENCRNY
ncbi:MAG: hypothetical protein LBB36_03335 [Fibromonadaceae bacterium]|jgi:hypothetical protein|nr:hypothetical protein [Fibromonadaceae bacterium]